jgi:high-affinity nickel permease
LAVSPGAFFAVGFMTVLIGICIQLSISISGMQEQIRCLSEEIAQLRFQADEGKN